MPSLSMIERNVRAVGCRRPVGSVEGQGIAIDCRGPPGRIAGSVRGSVDRLPVQAHAVARHAGDSSGEVGGSVEHFVVGLDGEDEPQPARLQRGDRLAGQRQELGPLTADARRQRAGPNQAEPSLGEPERRALPGDDEVA